MHTLYQAPQITPGKHAEPFMLVFQGNPALARSHHLCCLSLSVSLSLLLLVLQTTCSNDCTSKTLDSASAHFAASAVVSAPPQGHVNNENKPHKPSVNGVLHPSGELSGCSLDSTMSCWQSSPNVQP